MRSGAGLGDGTDSPTTVSLCGTSCGSGVDVADGSAADDPTTCVDCPPRVEGSTVPDRGAGADPGEDAPEHPCPGTTAAGGSTVIGALLPPGAHTKCCLFIVYSPPFVPSFVPASHRGQLGLDARLDRAGDDKCWSHNFASPKIEDGFFRMSRRGANSERRRAPALGLIKCSKWKDMFIEDYVAADIDAPFLGIKALEPLMYWTIAEEDTLFGTEFQFFRVVGTQVGPDGAPKRA